MKKKILILSGMLLVVIGVSAQVNYDPSSNTTGSTVTSGSALGTNNTATGTRSFAQGFYSSATGGYSLALGTRNTSSNNHAVTIGIDVQATANRSITIGSGSASSSIFPIPKLTNNISNSLMIGFNSTIPTFFVGEASGPGTVGSVGIGTSNPIGIFHVNSSPSFSEAPRFTMSSSGTNLGSVNTSFSLFNLDQTQDNWSRLHFGTTIPGGSEKVMVSLGVQYKNRNAGQETGDFVIATRGNGTYRENFRIAGNGNVSIGTNDSKGYKFAVNGSMIAEEITVKLYADWPDFVFTKEYGLMDLNKVEKYIAENSHLPNVPSAEEIEKDGINLGEMDAILLQKIEELTLHTIAQQKLIDSMAKKMLELSEIVNQQ